MKKNVLTLTCSEHGVQRFSSFGGATVTLRCGCTWGAMGEGLVFDRTLPYSEMWWEQTPAERLKYSSCATSKCKRKVVAYERQDYWCAVDLKRVKKLWAERDRQRC